MTDSIYGGYADILEKLRTMMEDRINTYTKEVYAETGLKICEHLIARVKSEESMREKCNRKGVPETPESALKRMRDSIGIRIICPFIDDIYENVNRLRSFPDCRVVEEKDYIRHAKPNGYRSYHMILELETDYPDISGNAKGKYFVEVQLRTIAMDSWAALEHQMKYKKHIENQELIVDELKRCADELASCDVSMQTIRNLIHQG